MEIRITTAADEDAAYALHEAAFGSHEGPAVAALTRALMHDPTASPLLSLLAQEGTRPVGHILFTSARVTGAENLHPAHILAPLAVRPDRQRQGIGGWLVKQGLSLLKESGSVLVFVLGHPEYYPRFGFRPAGRLGFSAPYPIPERIAPAWMVLELVPGIVGKCRGTVRCATSLDRPENWRE